MRSSNIAATQSQVHIPSISVDMMRWGLMEKPGSELRSLHYCK